MAAVELVADRESRSPAVPQTDETLKYCYEHGLIILKAGLFGNVVRILVPLVIDDDELAGGLEILDDALGAAGREFVH